jgi:hypothetical protein
MDVPGWDFVRFKKFQRPQWLVWEGGQGLHRRGYIKIVGRGHVPNVMPEETSTDNFTVSPGVQPTRICRLKYSRLSILAPNIVAVILRAGVRGTQMVSIALL